MLTTKYITADDYLQYFGEDLNVVLPDDDMPNGKAERFICGVEDDVELFLNRKCFKNINDYYPGFNDYQKKCYKMALLNQCWYKRHSGDIGNDSGYAPDTGIVAKRSDLEAIELSSKCIDYLSICGLYTRQIHGGRFFNPFIK